MTKKKSKTKTETTSIRINPEIWKQARIKAIELDMPVSKFLEEAIKHYVETLSTKTQ